MGPLCELLRSPGIATLSGVRAGASASTRGMAGISSLKIGTPRSRSGAENNKSKSRIEGLSTRWR